MKQKKWKKECCTLKKYEFNRYIDHAVLKPELTQEEVRNAIQLGIDYKVKTVCVRPCDIDLAVDMCRGTETGVCCVLAFPHGTVPPEIKRAEAELYVARGVDEIDMVVNYGYIRSRLWNRVEEDIRAVSEITKPANVLLKVILETSQLNEEEIVRATECAVNAGADFVKTSTGFYGEGATVKAVEVMLKAAAGRIGVKASGGIRTAEQARMFLDMGVSRIGNGFSSTPVICGGMAL
ncbi:deoxyribose-phosphate aldolase DeoC [Thermoclostridium stercorarium subsp. stercorarium DSM 8532]|uniref:Deoxyribose-phosphate aldolase n=1 Tax=Thermoclostridium stercorarium (strain ATCC 35414 / DSM 8532 / NCIMB 11754) TaxID=1121335 RepID=L7VN70_THES1|nr:deoxyribose-phosphate aldolase DeoC [Thermoclostridium stercorarium subsp. stercorarium DSM 8532]